MTHYMDDKELLTNYRGRRLVACRAIDVLKNVIDSMGIEENPKILPPVEGLPPAPSDGTKRELGNLASVLLRMILMSNDGHMSSQELRTF